MRAAISDDICHGECSLSDLQIAFCEADPEPVLKKLVSDGILQLTGTEKRRVNDRVTKFARLSQDETYWNLSHRAIVIAWLKACVLFVANGQVWEKAIEDFVRWSLAYDMYCKMAFFGADIELANNAGERVGQRGPRNLLELLPDEFTLEEARHVRQQQGLDASKKETMHMIRTWKGRGYCAQRTEHSFLKSEKYRHKTESN